MVSRSGVVNPVGVVVKKSFKNLVTCPPGPSGLAPLVPLEAAHFSKPPPKPVELEPAGGGNCPRCDSASVYLSKARSRFEEQLGRWKIPLCRCHRCYHRYFCFAGLKIPKEMPDTTQPRVKPHRRH